MIPKGLQYHHFNKLLRKLVSTVCQSQGNHTDMILLIDGKSYPPKYVISLAAKYATGTELESSQFSGGDETNNFLKSLGMEIMPKTGPQIAEMIETVLNTYVAARDGEPFNRQHELWGICDAVF